MSKKIQLTIADPCHESWDQMTAAEQGRFCASCQKQVVDFSSMSDSQLAAFFKKPSGDSVCGRFFQDQLDRDIEIPRKRIPWVKYFFQFALPAFMVSMKATAQGNVKVVRRNTITMSEVVVTARMNIFSKNNTGDSIAGMLSGKIKGPVITTDKTCNDLKQEVKSSPQLMLVQQPFVGWMGMVVVNKKPEKIKLSEPIPLLTQKLMDTAFRFFKIFPNPVSSGASLHIEWKNTEEGYYSFELFDLSGKKVYSKEIWIDAEARLLNIETPSVTAGNYFLRATNKQSGKSFTEKIIIE